MSIKPQNLGREEIKEPEVKTAEGIDLLLEPRVKIVYRDVASQWPSSDPLAENPAVLEDSLTVLLDLGWKIEKVEVYPRRGIGDLVNEFVIPMVFILSR